MSTIRDTREDEIQEVDSEDETPRNWRLSTDARYAILRGHRSDAAPAENKQTVMDSGKVFTDDQEPGLSTHVHRHEGGVTISVKDQNEGKVERYNFDTGEGFEKTVNEMVPNEAQHRMRSDHTEYNPNPDHDTISGFHSSTWPEFSDAEED